MGAGKTLKHPILIKLDEALNNPAKLHNGDPDVKKDETHEIGGQYRLIRLVDKYFDRLHPDHRKHLDDDWFDDTNGWWKGLHARNNIREGLRTLIPLALGKYPLWLVDSSYAPGTSSKVETEILEDPDNEVIYFIIKTPPEPPHVQSGLSE